MTSLKDVIAMDSILTVTVDPRSIFKVLSQLNDAMKRQAQRISDLEANQQSFITRSEHSHDVSSIAQMSEMSSKAIDQVLRESTAFKDELSRTREAFANDIDEKFNAALFTANMSLKQSLSDVQCQLDSHSQQFEAIKADQSSHDTKHRTEFTQLIEQIQRCNDRVSHHHSEVPKCFSDCQKKSESRSSCSIGAQNSSGTNDMDQDFQALAARVSKLEDNQKVVREVEDTLSKRVDCVYDAAVELVNSRIQKLHNSMQEAIALPAVDSDGRPFDDKIGQTSAMTNQTRVSLVGVLAQLTEHETRFDRLSQQIEQGLMKPSVISPELPRPDRPLFEGAWREEIDGLAEKVGLVSQDLCKLKALVGQNEHNLRGMVLAIIDEFKLIRGNAPGLDLLPPLNLSRCVPQFFNNPSFSFSRVDDTDDETARSTGPSQSISHSESVHETSKMRKLSGLLHLVSHPEDIPKVPTHPEVIKKLPTVEQPQQFVREISVQRILHTNSPEQILELRDMLTVFNTNKNELMSAVDRKVDRDMVERLFNKFKVLIVSINERVNELAALFAKCANLQDVEAVAKVVSKMPMLGEKPLKVVPLIGGGATNNRKPPVESLPRLTNHWKRPVAVSTSGS
jgi:hypothetical protein